MEGHDLDDDGEHDESACYVCLSGKEVKSDCRCGQCCRLIIEVDVRDAEREPRIAQEGSPILSDPRLTGSKTREVIGYLLNSPANGYACAFLHQTSNLCKIYDTRPLVCRLYNCETDGREQLIELGVIDRDKPDDVR